ncbi:unnamed protein product [Acanthoscelides obtectus]|uniref:C2H2-type domain-containing protein n=1 Tax=Acanthoscelides obtectus TaxID=200917 RepID=A0A9P0LJ13_ACAOB|nr:unnamed protein product [Acanthoscelides obtectus]CAK1664924.1 Zinc finger protein 142 [Acanthoscelides obtectus]
MLIHSEYKSITCVHCGAKHQNGTKLYEHIVQKHSDFIASVPSKIHECTLCTYKTSIKSGFDRHMSKHIETGDNHKINICIHCKAKFMDKTRLSDHIIKKHPDFISSVPSKIHECTLCNYKTTIKGLFLRHIFKHSETGDSYKFYACFHCEERFRTERRLNHHIIKKHPDFIASVTRKILECTQCKYKTTIKHNLTIHMLNHSKAEDNSKFGICLHCNAKFTTRRTLDDHIIKKHPDFIDSVSSKIHECMDCEYKTTFKATLCSHLLKHSKTRDNYKFRVCIHCKAKFYTNVGLNDHIIKKHPDFIDSVSSKIHECPHCSFKTTIKSCFVYHMSSHPDCVDNYQYLICNHCNAKFRKKILLNDHIIRKHPDFIDSISNKIHECMDCKYKTTLKYAFARHLLTHSKTGDNYNFSVCIHCKAEFKSKTDLNDHIIKKHPDFIESVSSKIHVCPHCTYKTTYKSGLAYHMLTHPTSVDDYKYLICNHCNAKFKSKVLLNDHIIRKHPDFIDSVSNKIHECTDCEYRTTFKFLLDRHMLKHSETGESHKFSICVHCKEQFKNQRLLNEHIIRKHPDFIASVYSKIHECPQCGFKTIMKDCFARHMLKHSELVAGSSV